jgi:multimeric flavodoxin WrbA
MSACGAAVETVFLTELAIERCRQCNADGWGICRSEGRCIIGDDFDEVERKLDAADAVVFANPVYFGDLSESMRAFTDRLRRCNWKAKQENGKTNLFKPVIGICLAGGGGGGAEVCGVSLKKVLTTCGFEVIDMIPVRRQNFDAKLKSLRGIGEWFPEYVTTGEWERVIPRPQ